MNPTNIRKADNLWMGQLDGSRPKDSINIYISFKKH